MSGNKRDRDRATEAFRRWARAGCPGMEEIRRHGGASAGELLACAAVFDVLQKSARRSRPGPEIIEAVRAVYMRDPGRPLRKSEVSMRVRRFGMAHYVSERTVYYWLTVARVLWREIADDCAKSLQY